MDLLLETPRDVAVRGRPDDCCASLRGHALGYDVVTSDVVNSRVVTPVRPDPRLLDTSV